MLRVNNTTTFAEVHQWISNFFSRTCSGTEDEQNPIGGVNNEEDPYMIAFNKWKQGKGQWLK
eukprot:5913458-Amphidinium_carterae.1